LRSGKYVRWPDNDPTSIVTPSTPQSAAVDQVPLPGGERPILAKSKQHEDDLRRAQYQELEAGQRAVEADLARLEADLRVQQEELRLRELTLDAQEAELHARAARASSEEAQLRSRLSDAEERIRELDESLSRALAAAATPKQEDNGHTESITSRANGLTTPPAEVSRVPSRAPPIY
jgi:chromosome segregation ATPase